MLNFTLFMTMFSNCKHISCHPFSKITPSKFNLTRSQTRPNSVLKNLIKESRKSPMSLLIHETRHNLSGVNWFVNQFKFLNNLAQKERLHNNFPLQKLFQLWSRVNIEILALHMIYISINIFQLKKICCYCLGMLFVL